MFLPAICPKTGIGASIGRTVAANAQQYRELLIALPLSHASVSSRTAVIRSAKLRKF